MNKQEQLAYDEILRRLKESQEKTDKRKMMDECMDIVKEQKEKERIRFAKEGADKRHTLLRLLKYLMKYRVYLIFAIVLSLATNGLSLLVPMFSGYAIDAIKPEGVEFSTVFYYCGLMLGVLVVSSIMSYILNLLMGQIARKIVSSMRSQMFDRILKMPIGFFDTHAAGDVISRINYDIDTVNTSLSNDVVSLFASVITVIGSFIMMLVISPALVMIFVVSVPISIFLFKKLAGITRPLFRARSGKLGELNGFIEEMIGGQKSLKAYNQEIHTIEKCRVQNEEAIDAYYRADYMGSMVGPVVNGFTNVPLCFITIFGAIMYLFGQITLGNISSFMLYSRRFSGPINESANIISELQSAIAAAERVFRMLDEPVEKEDDAFAKVLEDVYGNVELKHVSFGYNKEKEIIHDLNLTAPAGKLVAIVGPTGAGKSTIINLLMRFYDVDSGEIDIDGSNIEQVTRRSLRKSFAMVLQDTWLFHGSIYENIAYGKEDATLDDVIRVCKAARIHNYIMRLPEKYDTILSDDGTNVSKGQKQLLTIARAMLLDANMLILDEATSNVDTRTEMQIQEALLKLMEGKTCFVIAHRLSTIQNADTILVVRDGDVVEQGNHQELMDANGFYRSLYDAQFAGVEI